MTIYTAIIGNYDDLKEPFVITPGWKYVCFTDQNLKSDVWEIRKVKPIKSIGDQKTARYYKVNFHEFIEDEFSIWVDATFFINCNLDKWWRQVKHPFTTLFHPFDNCLYKDADSCLKLHKGSPLLLNRQVKFYKGLGIPENNGLISSGILMRQRTKETMDVCKEWWQQIERFSPRDQIAFGYVNWKFPQCHNSFSWDYTYMKEFIHIPHLHKTWRHGKLNETIKMYGTNPA